ncbi:hypothetical protein HDU76_001053 [Blyttiomyces sp. JEL0837]|nr:hypothetical protein HDU76_001053 [Blyttiomyces sp. JEL0837]
MAHQQALHTCIFLPNQPVLLTAGYDNSLKQWILDQDSEPPRLWKSRSGHFEPPTRIKYLGSDAKNILSAGKDGALRKFSTIQDAQNVEFSSKGGSSNLENASLSEIVYFDSCDPNLTTWDNIVTCHANDPFVRTWNSRKGSLGKFTLKTQDGSVAKVVAISHCGNFCFIGSQNAGIDMYNLQSGILKKSFSKTSGKGHKKPIFGLGVDSVNTKLVSAGLDSSIKVWDTATGKVSMSIPMTSSVSAMHVHSDNNIVAVACDDLALRIIDIDSGTIVRELWGHTNRILDISLSPDSRSLVSSSLDGTLRIWDLPTGNMISSTEVTPVTSVAFAPDGNYLATSHVNDRGLTLWTSISLFGSSQLPVERAKLEEHRRSLNFDFISAADRMLIQLSSIPLSRVQLLMNMETFRVSIIISSKSSLSECAQKRKEPEKAVEKPESAPFFLSLTSSVSKANVHDDSFSFGSDESASRILRKTSALGFETKKTNFQQLFDRMIGLSPAAIDFEIRSITSDEFAEFCKVFARRVESRSHFEFNQAILNTFLEAHGDALLEHARIEGDDTLLEALNNVLTETRRAWQCLEDLFHSNLSILDHVRVMDLLANNPYFSAGFGLIGVGAGLAILKQAAVQSASLLRRRLLVTVEIPSRDPSYNWFLQWSSRHGLGHDPNLAGIKTGSSNANAHSSSRAKATSSSSPFSFRERLRRLQSSSILSKLAVSNQLSVETTFLKRENGSSVASLSLVPAPGRHFFRYKSAWFQIERARERTMVDLKSGTPWETVTVTTLARDRGILMEILEEAKRAALESEEGKTVIFTSYGPDWRPFGMPRRRRELDSVILDDKLSEFLVSDVKAFLKNGQWYHDRGERGYLLYGPPGSGKTSFIQALAGHLQYNICVMNLSERGMTDDRLAHLLANSPPRSFILLEDIDAAFTQRNADDKQGYHSMVTFSGLLNALDGVAASEERLVFMTTNHVERLDPALIRPGRVDVRVLLDNATDSQARAMFLRFYPGCENLAEEFVAKIRPEVSGGKRCSPASLQGHFVFHRDNPQAAIDTVANITK